MKIKTYTWSDGYTEVEDVKFSTLEKVVIGTVGTIATASAIGTILIWKFLIDNYDH